MNPIIAITALGSVSPLGNEPLTIWKKYLEQDHFFINKSFGHFNALVALLDPKARREIETLQKSEHHYRSLDLSVLYAITASRQAINQAKWSREEPFGINLGSSRGATRLFEDYHKEFLDTGYSKPLSSPTTTLGNISSWVAHDLQSKGPEISHSITCSTALHALLNGVAWLRSGMVTRFLVGGSEAPLTAFTIAQMKALKIYAQNNNLDFPCRALDHNKTKNTMILGEGASVACLELGEKSNALAYIEGIGYATELLEHNISISKEADCFQKAMLMAIGKIPLHEIDIIVMHAPGTIKGDQSEYLAIKKVFGQYIPLVTTNKWKIGHSFGASGMFSIEFAILMLQHQTFIGVPFSISKYKNKPIKKILVNAVGFGGNAVSVLLQKS